MSNQESTGREPDEEGFVREDIAAIPDLPKIIRFDSLARCGEEVWIENNGQIYRLRKTKQGKLILTK
jgi:hemin uptake protein HemP